MPSLDLTALHGGKQDLIVRTGRNLGVRMMKSIGSLAAIVAVVGALSMPSSVMAGDGCNWTNCKNKNHNTKTTITKTINVNINVFKAEVDCGGNTCSGGTATGNATASATDDSADATATSSASSFASNGGSNTSVGVGVGDADSNDATGDGPEATAVGVSFSRSE